MTILAARSADKFADVSSWEDKINMKVNQLYGISTE
jgi:hypothetical protein